VYPTASSEQPLPGAFKNANLFSEKQAGGVLKFSKG